MGDRNGVVGAYILAGGGREGAGGRRLRAGRLPEYESMIAKISWDQWQKIADGGTLVCPTDPTFRLWLSNQMVEVLPYTLVEDHDDRGCP